MITNDVPPWLYCTEKFQLSNKTNEKIDDYQNIPETSEILDIDKFQNIVDICKDWKYDNEGRKYPCDVYHFCMIETDKVLHFSKTDEKYLDIYQMLTETGEDSLELYYPCIAMNIRKKSGILTGTASWLKKIVPVEMGFSTNFTIDVSKDGIQAKYFFSYRRINQSITFHFEVVDGKLILNWENLKDNIINLQKNYLELIEKYKQFLDRQKNLEVNYKPSYSEDLKYTSNRLEEIKKELKFSYLEIDLDFELLPSELFMFSKYKSITNIITVPNILIYPFIDGFCKFIEFVEHYN